MKPVAIGYRVVIELDPVEEKSAGGIIITSKVRETDEICCTIGTVVDMGEFCFWNKYDGTKGFPKAFYAIGDRVIFAEHSGRLWKDEATGINYRIMQDEDILCKVE